MPSTLNFGAVSAGSAATSAGKSHSWLRPTSQSRRPSAQTISVALAIRLTTRLLPLPARGEGRGEGQRLRWSMWLPLTLALSP